MKMTYDDYLGQAKILAKAGHNRSDVLKALRTLYLLNDGDLNPTDELGVLIADIENNKHAMDLLWIIPGLIFTAGVAYVLLKQKRGMLH